MLEINLLGEISIHLDGDSINRFRSQTEIALLAYLAHSGQIHNREALADLLWDASTDRAVALQFTHCLNQTANACGGSSHRHAQNDRSDSNRPSTN